MTEDIVKLGSAAGETEMGKGQQATDSFTETDILDLDVELKVGILATVNEDGLPHLTMISSLRPYHQTGLVFGQFTEGLSKRYLHDNPKAGFLMLSLDRHVWRGKALFSHTAKGGAEYENYNNLPMFRYNAYFGVHTVYYLDLVALQARQALPMGIVVYAALTTLLARKMGRSVAKEEVINTWSRDLFNKLDNLKFLGYIGADGYPVVLPVIQTQAMNSEYVIFSNGFLKELLEGIPVGISMALFAMSFDMEDVLLRGTFQGFRRVGGVRCGLVEIDWVYNSMPPNPKQVYPPITVKPIRNF